MRFKLWAKPSQQIDDFSQHIPAQRTGFPVSGATQYTLCTLCCVITSMTCKGAEVYKHTWVLC